MNVQELRDSLRGLKLAPLSAVLHISLAVSPLALLTTRLLSSIPSSRDTLLLVRSRSILLRADQTLTLSFTFPSLPETCGWTSHPSLST